MDVLKKIVLDHVEKAVVVAVVLLCGFWVRGILWGVVSEEEQRFEGRIGHMERAVKMTEDLGVREYPFVAAVPAHDEKLKRRFEPPKYGTETAAYANRMVSLAERGNYRRWLPPLTGTGTDDEERPVFAVLCRPGLAAQASLGKVTLRAAESEKNALVTPLGVAVWRRTRGEEAWPAAPLVVFLPRAAKEVPQGLAAACASPAGTPRAVLGGAWDDLGVKAKASYEYRAEGFVEHDKEGKDQQGKVVPVHPPTDKDKVPYKGETIPVKLHERSEPTAHAVAVAGERVWGTGATEPVPASVPGDTQIQFVMVAGAGRQPLAYFKVRRWDPKRNDWGDETQHAMIKKGGRIAGILVIGTVNPERVTLDSGFTLVEVMEVEVGGALKRKVWKARVEDADTGQQAEIGLKEAWYPDIKKPAAQAPGRTPERAPERTPERTPEAVPEPTPERTPTRRPRIRMPRTRRPETPPEDAPADTPETGPPEGFRSYQAPAEVDPKQIETFRGHSPVGRERMIREYRTSITEMDKEIETLSQRLRGLARQEADLKPQLEEIEKEKAELPEGQEPTEGMKQAEREVRDRLSAVQNEVKEATERKERRERDVERLKATIKAFEALKAAEKQEAEP